MGKQRPTRFFERLRGKGLWLAIACLLALQAAQATKTESAGLDRGFRQLYDLNFPGAQKEFESWEKENPENPMGPVAEAAGILFSEFDRLGVLEAQFYEDDSILAARKKYEANPQQRARFEQRLDRAEALARAKLARDPRNGDALLAMTLSNGLRSDFAALIEKRNMASLHYTKEATAWAQQLLAADPGCYDAHLASGVSRYIVGSMAAPVRWILRLGGIAGDKAGGIAELQTTAAQGHLLAPFARILLAIAYVREKDLPRARELLLALQRDFPGNPLFGRELARLDQRASR
ncbi:conserved exported hypothetical protein [Candidatus Sulfotelmatobacter sp. SbA7]|nr:conserved exported hypothetical protein [Candidatus Sulfotelmatobacter sp. SbA7]